MVAMYRSERAIFLSSLHEAGKVTPAKPFLSLSEVL